MFNQSEADSPIAALNYVSDTLLRMLDPSLTEGINIDTYPLPEESPYGDLSAL